MCNILADSEHHRFLVGTCSLQTPNQVHVLVFHEDTNTIELETVIPFEHREVYALKSSPYNSSIFAASYVGNAEDNDRAEICITQFNQGSIEETKDEEIYQKGGANQTLAVLKPCSNDEALQSSDLAYDDPLLSIQWEDNEANTDKQAKELLACNSQNVFLWDLNTCGLSRSIACKDLNPKSGFLTEQNDCKCAKRNPHDNQIVAVAYGRRFEVVDLRAGGKSVLSDAHLHASQPILDLDFNPIKVNTVATTGMDSYVRFWDLRKMGNGKCVMEYNQSGILSGGNDFSSKFSISNRNSSNLN